MRQILNSLGIKLDFSQGGAHEKGAIWGDFIKPLRVQHWQTYHRKSKSYDIHRLQKSPIKVPILDPPEKANKSSPPIPSHFIYRLFLFHWSQDI